MNTADLTMPNEQSLAQQAQADPAAFARLYDHYLRRVYNYMRYRLNDAQMADDLTAQVFHRAWEKRHNHDPEKAPFGAWLFGIARHVINDHYRRQKRFGWLSLEVLRERFSLNPPPEEAFIQSEMQTLVLQAVARLNEREREIVALKFGGNLNNVQIAELTGLTASNVGVILYRAMKQLKAALETQGVSK
ncbi:MAG: RNA polymerase subunit sigma-24 [Anaerolineaceae bacterium]|nr:RNA polymerase subunit sigma-24 [Anaerolineaceae bacterium]